VHGDAREPCAHRRRIAQLRQLRQRHHEGVLQRILGLAGRAEHALEQAAQRRAEAAEQRRLRRRVTPLRPQHPRRQLDVERVPLQLHPS
jgi:hypothetical protein